MYGYNGTHHQIVPVQRYSYIFHDGQKANYCINNEKKSEREKFRPWLLSHVHTPGGGRERQIDGFGRLKKLQHQTSVRGAGLLKLLAPLISPYSNSEIKGELLSDRERNTPPSHLLLPFPFHVLLCHSPNHTSLLLHPSLFHLFLSHLHPSLLWLSVFFFTSSLSPSIPQRREKNMDS